MNKILENMMKRKSCRAFTEEPVSKQAIEEILTAAIYAPTGMNQQSWQFTVVQDREKIQHLAGTMKAALGMTKEYNMYNPPVIILVSNEKDNTNGLADCACAMENMMLMATELNLGSCWINQLKTICDREEIREILNSFHIPENHVVWATLSLGHAAVELQDKERNENAIVYVK